MSPKEIFLHALTLGKIVALEEALITLENNPPDIAHAKITLLLRMQFEKLNELDREYEHANGLSVSPQPH